MVVGFVVREWCRAEERAARSPAVDGVPGGFRGRSLTGNSIGHDDDDTQRKQSAGYLVGIGIQVGAMSPIRPNVIWAKDFQFDTTADGPQIKMLRTRAGRSGGHLESVCPLDQLDGDDEADSEGDRVESVVDEPVGVAA